MFQDLVDLFSGWYLAYVQTVRDILQYDLTEIVAVPGDDYSILTDTVTNHINPDIWAAYVPWEHIIAAVTLIVFIVCVFKFMRSVLCKIL